MIMTLNQQYSKRKPKQEFMVHKRTLSTLGGYFGLLVGLYIIQGQNASFVEPRTADFGSFL